MNSDDHQNPIKPIDRGSVHRICSGQVVLNLATAVKELVENSLDAGATAIDVRLMEYGSDLIEVADNGSGVHPDNFTGLTLKHHTSKIRDFSDILSVETFGFRGEALSSLCALSNVSILTRHITQNCGTNLIFDNNGCISEQSQSSRQVGTTVTLTNLFSPLPVRHKEFIRNLKREFTKMTQLLNAYCLVSTGVRINCTNQLKKGGKTTFVSTRACKTVKENIACVFGSKQLNNLLEIKGERLSPEVLEDLGCGKEVEQKFNLEGYVSSCAHGEGRATNDRQYYFINSRPCEPVKVMRTVNEVYHQFNLHQFPFVYLNIKLARDSVDVNVTPDKRQVFLDQEKLLLAVIKASLLHLYENIPSTYRINSLGLRPQKTVAENSEKFSLSKLSDWTHKSVSKRVLEPVQEQTSRSAKQIKLGSCSKSKSLLESYKNEKRNREEPEGVISTINTKLSHTSPTMESQKVETNEIKLSEGNDPEISEVCEVMEEVTENECSNLSATSITVEGSKSIKIVEINTDLQSSTQGRRNRKCESTLMSEVSENDAHKLSMSDNTDLSQAFSETHSSPLRRQDSISISEMSLDNTDITIEFDSEEVRNSQEKELEMDLSIEYIRASFKKQYGDSLRKTAGIKFHAAIDPDKNSEAEKELNREITKDMFSKMDIIGQFNLGFIIVKLGSDLFIVDQHATDEKYNFETLQKTTVISNQSLVVPQKLDLTAINECILIENVDIFKKNGFEFIIDDSAPATQKVSLAAVPLSRNWVFGKEDIDELIFMLQDSPNTFCRPSRVRAMFASRACRKSVMIGTALSHQEMKRLIIHMGEIEQPWNCPHGRPTMRHLVNLDLLGC